MLHIPLNDQQFTAHQRRLNRPSIVPLHSNLTAALQASGNAEAFPQQLSPASQVCDLARRGGNEENYLPLNTGFQRANLKYVGSFGYLSNSAQLTESVRPPQDSIEPFPRFEDANHTILQDDPATANNVVPWSHLRAFSAPDPRLAPFSDHSESQSGGLYPCSPDALGSFEGKRLLLPCLYLC